MASREEAPGTALRFFLSSDISIPVQFRLDALARLPRGAPHPSAAAAHEKGCSQSEGESEGENGDVRETEKEGVSEGESERERGSVGEEEEEDEEEWERQLFVEAQVFVDGMPFGLPEVSQYSGRDSGGVFRWRQWLELPARYCDLTSTAQLALTVWDASDVVTGRRLVGGTTVRLFSEPQLAAPHLPGTGPSHTQNAHSRQHTQPDPQAEDGQAPGAPDANQAQAGGGTGEGAPPGGLSGPGVSPGAPLAASQLLHRQGMLRMGKAKLKLWLGREADGEFPTTTPGKIPRGHNSEAERLEQLVAMYDRGEIPRVPWLDRLSFPIIDAALDEEHTSPSPGDGSGVYRGSVTGALNTEYTAPSPGEGDSRGAYPGDSPGAQKGGGAVPILSLEFPTFDHPVAYQDIGGLLPPSNIPHPGTNQNGNTIVVHAWDPEVLHRHVPNPSELKQLKLSRMVTRDSVDRDLKPNLQERKEIGTVLRRPPTHALSKEDVQLLWRFRFSLMSNKHALTKFLRCVDWSDAKEATQATELMYQWAPIDTADALELLSSSFLSEQVRGYAVTVLGRADDEEIKSYLLELVHALRYERSDNSDLAAFLVTRGCSDFVLANFLHWYLRVERQDPNFAARYAFVHDTLLSSLLKLGPKGQEMHETILRQSELDLSLCKLMLELKAVRGGTARKAERLRQLLHHSELGANLIDLGKPLALPLDPRLETVGLEAEACSVFKSALHPLKLTFRMTPPPPTDTPTGDPTGHPTALPLDPATGPPGAPDSVKTASHSEPRSGSEGPSGRHEAREGGERGREAEGAETVGGGEAGGVPGVRQQSSAGEPGPGQGAGDRGGAGAGAEAEERGSGAGAGGGAGGGAEDSKPRVCRVIFKKGDDLRQDQLVIQLVALMDRLLKKENLDLKLTPYRVLATSSDQGYVEFVPSIPLAQVLAEHRSIVRYLSQFHPNPDAPPGSPPSISPHCLDTFLRSCAGYCVIMYILGVGDRHLDNLLLCQDGRLFHIDFGFILGRDPKPFPPPMKLCREMVDVMGGGAAPGSSEPSTAAGKWDSADYRRFRSYCCEAFNILRSHSRLILNLFHLMAHSSIPDFATDPDNVVLKIEQKFRLDLDDAGAVQFIQSLIHESVSALFPQMVETIHRWAQYWR